MLKTCLTLLAIAACIAMTPTLAAAKGHSYKAPKAPKAETTKVEAKAHKKA